MKNVFNIYNDMYADMKVNGRKNTKIIKILLLIKLN